MVETPGKGCIGKHTIQGGRLGPMKTARILDEEDDSFGLEYDNNLGQKNTMRLDAATYERAVREAKSFLGINPENLDGDGTAWEIE